MVSKELFPDREERRNKKEIDLKDWKYYLEGLKITTNSRWLTSTSDKPIFGNFFIPKRDFLPPPSRDFHGVWIPEIPYQMMMRFTKIGDKVWSQFGGSGTDYVVAEYLERVCYINDLTPKKDFIVKADSLTYKTPEKVKLILSHPPYWDMIKFSELESDGSSKESLLEFLLWWDKIVKNSLSNLENKGFFVFACGNLYKNSEEITLGNLMMLVALNNGFILKQQIIKDYGQTKGSEVKNYNLNYYRQIRGNYGNFYGDNIFVMQKSKSKNNITSSLMGVLDKAENKNV